MLAKRELNLTQRKGGELSRRLGAPTAGASRKSGVLRSIWRRRGVVVVLTALSLLPAIVYLRLATPLFTSTSNLLIRHAVSNGGASLDQPDGTMDEGELAAQRNVIISTPVLAAALAAPRVRDCDPLRDHHDIIPFLKRSLDIEIGNGNQLTVSMSSTDPEDATCIVAAVVGSYSQFLSSLRRGSNSDLLATLRAERAVDQAELSRKSADLLRFGEEHHVGGGADISATGAAELARLSEAVSVAHVETVQATTANNDLSRALEEDPIRAENLKSFEESSPPSGTADDQELIHREILAVKAKQGELAQKLMAGHPSLVRLQARIDQLNLELDASIQRRAISAVQREADLQRAFDEEQRRILDQTAQQAEYSQRSEELLELQKTIDGVNQRIAKFDVADATDTPTVTVLDPAMASPEPTSPKRQRILLLTAGAGLLLSSLLACWLERGRIAAFGQDGAGLNVPILAELPRLPTDFSPLGGGVRLLASEVPGLAEIFNGLNAVIEGAKVRGRGAIVLITSPSRGDGKSTLASNLAVSLAQTHKRVLLIDADLRSQAQAKIFGTGNATGLAMLMEAEVSIPITAIHHTGTHSLDVIPGGPVTRNPSELLNSQRFIDLLGDMAERYDYILIDSPPTVTYTDARTISASCDVTMMVARTEVLNRRMLQIAAEGLTIVGANLCGLVLNSGQDDERSEEIFNEGDMSHDRASHDRAGRQRTETAAKNKVADLLLAAARAVDLVRTQPTNQRFVRRRALENGHKTAPRSQEKLLPSSLPPQPQDQSDQPG